MNGRVEDGAIGRQTIRALDRRILPLLFVLYLFSFLDRSNVGLAALQMNDDLRFAPSVFGAGAGLFSIGYALFEIPGNMMLGRVGARRWMSTIVVSWGILATSMMFVHSPQQFYSIRFLLGAAEAGFFPGIVFYIAQWYPAAHRARAAAAFMVAIPISQVVGGVVSGPLLALGGTGNLSGWQWLFMLEGLPTIALGMFAWFRLAEGPGEARWLAAAERDWLAARLKADHAAIAPQERGFWLALRSPVCWCLAAMYFCFLAIGVGYTSWMPLLVRGALGTLNGTTGLVTSIISLIAVAPYVVSARLSDSNDDRYLFAVAGLALCAAGCLGAAFAPIPWMSVASLAMIPVGSGVFMPSFWCIPTIRFCGPSAASAVALISTVGSIGGFVGPVIIGNLTHRGGTSITAFLTLAGIGVAGCGLGLVLRYGTASHRH